ncbi:UNVERIFIED_ORG: DNA repair protein RadC [Bacillus proteolyticus]
MYGAVMQQDECKVSSNKQAAKIVNIVSVKLVREASLLYKEPKIASPDSAYELLKGVLGQADREYFVVACLDTKNQPTSINICHIGSLNSSLVHPREVYKTAVLSNAASVIVAHNHPSQNPEPSHEDIEVTKRLMKAGSVLGIELLDHLIICEDKYVSLKEKGYM